MLVETLGAARLRKAWLALLLALLLLISYLALAPHPPRGVDTGWDKLNHFFAFGALTALSIACTGSRLWRWRLLPLMWLAYGGLIELVQMFEPTRSAEWTDLLADAIGIGTGMAVAATLAWLVARLR